jgi:hypothetical protein
MNIKIKTIPQKKQRYRTVGDYWERAYNNIEIRVSDCHNWKYEMLVAVHELIELLLCKNRKIDFKKIDEFDLAHLESDDPGMLKEAPYHREHKFALKIEEMLAKELKVNWNEYNKKLMEIVDGG